MGTNGDKNSDIGFQIGGECISNCQSSGMNLNPYISPAWDPVVSPNHHESFGGSSMVSQSGFSSNPYHGNSSTSHLVHYTPDSSYVEILPNFPSYATGSFSEMVGSFGLTSVQSQEDQKLSEEPVAGASPDGRRRKRLAESTSPCNDPNKNAEGELQKDLSGRSSDVPKEQDEKKSRTEQIAASNSQGKRPTEQAKESSNSGEAPKENYIHVRARRGQATNSHSLAERVRREKITERMRLIQELVPGCNKITGKAVMLDEIINYVQSLQQQVEFLSMKLATVNPEPNIDIDRILSTDILHSRGGNAAIMGSSPGMCIHPYSHGFFPANLPVIPSSNPPFPPVPHNVIENDLQNLLQMGFQSSTAVDNLGPNGRLKPEL